MLKVLVVDDEAQVRALLATVLGADEVRLSTAADYASALERIQTSDVDVAIIDKNLPDGSGLELIRTLKARRPDSEAILITGYASLKSAIEAVEVGAFDYLLKPFEDVHALRLKVRNAAEKVRLRRLEKQLQQAQKMEALGRLAGSVSHDFNNLLCVMLNGAQAASELVQRGDTGEETREHLSAVLVAIDSATRLTRQLLAFSRRPLGTPEVLDVNEVVAAILPLLRRLAGEDRAVEVSLADTLPKVKVARTQLEQVLVNLVVNARDALPPGGTVRIATSSNGERVTLAVSDSGGGYGTYDPLLVAEENGRSIGMSIVVGILERAGGSISVDEEGHGTRFRISLPATRERPVERPSAIAGLPESVGETVLIADDDEGMRALLTRAFTRAGYLVASARNAADATLKFESLGGDVDLLVTDLVMPLMNGRELAARLRRLRPSLRVVYLSGYAPSELEAVGVVPPEPATDGALLHKPFSPDELGRAVRHALGRAG